MEVGNLSRAGNYAKPVPKSLRFPIGPHCGLGKAVGDGNGYEHATVINDKGRRRKVLTYLATPDYIDDSLKLYG
ncbi:hypothetical protein [Phyllobacterium endophyticum]|uniref:hypothetical protein n=1 Tax=Phyllobacterium endophyticum TaxID=1149773 RepID=UPI0011C9A594|nr:hypothetical protein [Phyllobacterium endophyticum]TXR49468.1 hypothetical protein FVA77_09080 [Phyllobacterium endophyticum]